MFNKFALIVLGLTLLVTSVGGCCHGYGYNTNYGNRCAPCNNGCAPQGGYYPPAQGAFYQGGATQTAYVDPGQAAFAPMTTAYSSGAYSPTASAFVPTSTAAMIPGAIAGPPIYNTAVVPANTLPMY